MRCRHPICLEAVDWVSCIQNQLLCQLRRELHSGKPIYIAIEIAAATGSMQLNHIGQGRVPTGETLGQGIAVTGEDTLQNVMLTLLFSRLLPLPVL